MIQYIVQEYNNNTYWFCCMKYLYGCSLKSYLYILTLHIVFFLVHYQEQDDICSEREITALPFVVNHVQLNPVRKFMYTNLIPIPKGIHDTQSFTLVFRKKQLYSL